MNILFFTRRFYPQIGGVEKHILEISKRLIKEGHKITIITESQTKFTKKFSIKGISVFTINAGRDDWFKKIRIWESIWHVRKLIVQSDIIHCHDVFFWYLPFRFIYPNKKVYTTFHGYESFPISKKAILIRKISEKLSSGNICIGDFIPKWYGTEPTVVSYGAVEVANKYVAPFIKGGRGDFNSAVFIGRLDEQTGILEYTKATEILKKQIPDFKLMVIGDGKYKKRIAQKTKVLGFQNNPEKYFQQYHFAFVSRYLSILEAMAAKRLVFTTYDNPVKEDYLKLSPFAQCIVIEKDAKALAGKVFYYLNNPDKEEELINTAYNWVAKQTWEQMVDIYLKLWSKK